MYRQVRHLLDAELLAVERSGPTPEGKKYDLHGSRVQAASLEVDASGERVAWTPNEPREVASFFPAGAAGGAWTPPRASSPP